MEINLIKLLRNNTGLGIMACSNALTVCDNNIEKATHYLQNTNDKIVLKKSIRTTAEGLTHAYIHDNGRITVAVEVNCETDFAAKTADFKNLVLNIAMHIAAMSPKFIQANETSPDHQGEVLLLQSYYKDPSITVADVINRTIAILGENIKVKRFIRYELGDDL